MQKPNIIISKVLPIVGIVLSLYALYVEKRHAEEEQSLFVGEKFEALCDIESIGASCSAVFAMPEGRMLTYFKIVPPGSLFDVPNAALGLIYYHIVLLLSNTLPSKLIFAISVGAMSASVFLAIRLVQLNELCILCWTTHIINTTLLVYLGRRVWAEGESCVSKKKDS